MKEKDKRKTKGTDAEIALRIATIYEMVVKGASRQYIVRYCAEKFQINERQVDTYLNRVHNEIRATYGEEYKVNLLSKHIAQLDDLYVKNYTIEDFRECRSVIESKNKLLGLGETNVLKAELKGEVAVSNSVKIDYSNLSTETLTELLNNIQKED